MISGGEFFGRILKHIDTGRTGRSRSVIFDRPDLLPMDRLWSALVANRPQNALLIHVSQSEMTHEVKVTFEELGWNKLACVAYSLRHGGPSWDFVKKFRGLEEIQQRGLRPKSVKTSECNAIGGAQTGRVRKVLRRQPRARCFPGLAIDASSRLGKLQRVSRAIKRHVPAEIWSPWSGTERDVAQSDKKAQLVKRIRRGTTDALRKIR